MTSPPLLLRLQAESPTNRNALAITRPARPKQSRFFKFFPLRFVIGNLQLAISISSIANYKSQIIANYKFISCAPEAQPRRLSTPGRARLALHPPARLHPASVH